MSSNHGTLQARIELQREKVRTLELAAQERQRIERLHDQEQHQRRLEQTRRRDEELRQCRLRQALARQARLAQEERKRELGLQRDEQRLRERQVRDELGMGALLRYKAAVEARKAEGSSLAKLKEEQEAQRLRLVILSDLERKRVLAYQQDEQRRRDRQARDESAMRAHLRHEAGIQAQRFQQRTPTQDRIVAYDGPIPSFLGQEYQYMRQASTSFPEEVTPSIQMLSMKAYEKAISDAARRLPCGLCGGVFQEDEMKSIGLRDDNLQYFLQRTRTAPDCCAVKGDTVSLCATCSSTIAKRAIPPLSAGNFVNCLFCQDYPDALKNLNTVEEAFIARAHVIGIFLKLTSGAKGGISYRGSRGHSVAVRQDPSELLKILPAARLRDHTTITVSWDRAAPPSEKNLARFCSVDKAKVVNALLWLCANNPVYKLVVVDYSVLDSWPDHHIPQEIRDAFITLGPEPGSTDTPVENEREGYATSFPAAFDGATTDDDYDGNDIDASRFAAGDKVAVQAWFGSYVFTNKSGKTVCGPTFRLLKLWRLQAAVSGSSSLKSSPVSKRKRIL